MRAHGISGCLLNWINSWLTNRKQRTVLNGVCSEWGEVLSGVPQGSVLGPLAFLVYINDLDNSAELVTIMRKFANDTKVGQTIISDQDRVKLQKCLDDFVEWSHKWGMEFNVPKCKIMHIGKNNPMYAYTMSGDILQTTDEERDLGVIINKNMKPSSQCRESAKKALKVLGQISRTFHFRDRHVFLNLYKQYVRPHLEFCVPVWSPWSAQDINIIEKVQMRAVNMISGLSGRSYEDKLQELHLISLADRRNHYDLTQTFEILKNIDRSKSEQFFTTFGLVNQANTRNRSYPLNILNKRSRTEVRKNFFSVRVIEPWNKLPSDIKDSTSVKIFKKKCEKLIR